MATKNTKPSTPPEYSDHVTQLAKSQPDPQRLTALENSLLAAFKNVVEYRQVAYICFGDLNAKELSEAFYKFPLIIKATLSCVNVAQRAITRDLGITFDTYSNKITFENSSLLAGYIKPMLPKAIAIPALMELDRYSWTDKELRANKGNWEKRIIQKLCDVSQLKFIKRKFTVAQSKGSKSEAFELDASYEENGKITIGIDIKRIESPRDIHKRADEIINKASKYKLAFPTGKFIAIVYYPFPTQHTNVLSRLESADIDGIFFAGESDSSIENSIEMLAGKLAIKK